MGDVSIEKIVFSGNNIFIKFQGGLCIGVKLEIEFIFRRLLCGRRFHEVSKCVV